MEFLKGIIKPETYEALETEINEYCEKSGEKVRLVNVSNGEYVKKGKLDKAEQENSRLQEQIENLQKSLEDKDSDSSSKLKELQDQIDGFKRQEEERKAEQRISERFDAVIGNNEFVNAFTENGVREAFKKAIAESVGKSDAEIYSSVVETLGDVYKNPHKPADIPPMGRDVDSALDAEKFKGMSLDEQMKFANTHSEQYHNLFKE